MEYDVIIIGGGLLGCSVAYHLAKKQAGRIAVVERKEVASQASSRAACLLTRARTKPALMDMVQETYNCIGEMESLLGESLELQRCGSITVASSEASLKGLEALEQAACAFGIPNERLDHGQVQALLPWMDTQGIQASLYMPTDCFIDSSLLCSGYARAAKQLGVEFHLYDGVKAIRADQGQVSGVVLDSGRTMEAGKVVNAAGAWANLLMRPLGVGLPFTPVRSHFWITDIDARRFPVGHPFTVIPDARAFTRSDVGALMIGLRESTCQAFDPGTLTETLEDFDFHRAAKWTVLDECAPLLKTYLPDIERLGIAHYVAGPSCYVPDAMFVVGAIPAYKGLYTATGCCGAGVAAGGGIGRLLAEIMLEEETFVDASLFRPERFGPVDPFSPDFQLRCAAARSNKKGG